MGRGTKKAIGIELTRQRTPAHQRNRDPHQIRIPIKAHTLEQTRPLDPKPPPQHPPKPHGHEARVPVNQARAAAQEAEIVREVAPPAVRKVLAYRARQEEDDDDGRGDPDGAVQVRVAVQHVEEVGARVQGGGAAAEDLCCVDVEGLGVEGEGPEVVFSVGGAVVCGGGCGAWEEGGGCVARDFGGGGGGGFEVYGDG